MSQGRAGFPAGDSALPDLVYLVHEPNNEGLLYSLRSVDRFATDMFGKIWTVGAVPSWMTNVGHIKVDPPAEKFASIRAKLAAACANDQVANHIVVMNDDFYALRPVESWDPTHMGSTSSYVAQQGDTTNTWIEAMRVTAEWMTGRGHGDIPCYAGHIPLIYDRKKLGALIAEYPTDRRLLDCGLYPEAGVGSVGTRGPNTKVGDPSIEALRQKLPDPSNPPTWLSSNEASLAGALGDFIRATFSRPCQYEIPGGFMHDYTVMISGLPHTVRLTDAQARERGITPYSERPVKVPEPTPEPKQAAAPANKARKPRGNKAARGDRSDA